MDKVELMQVEDTFLLESVGLVLAPSFELPPEAKWENINEQIPIETPDGKKLNAEALFSITHLNIRDPNVSVSKRWPVLISLKNVEKESVPIGSTIFVTEATKKAIKGENA